MTGRDYAALALALLCSACGGTMGWPKYRTLHPPTLPSQGPPLASEKVTLLAAERRMFDFTSEGGPSGTVYRVAAVELPAGPEDGYRRLGDLRSASVSVLRPNAQARRLKTRTALADLRARAARLGIPRVLEIRCFVLQKLEDGYLWCEGVGAGK
jgi:hypothetical protein